MSGLPGSPRAGNEGLIHGRGTEIPHTKGKLETLE